MRCMLVLMRAAIVLCFALLGCSTTSSTPPDPQPRERTNTAVDREQPQVSNDEEPIDPRFVDTLLTAAREHRAWGRVDEYPNLAPILCRAPQGLDYGFPSHARISGADEAPHGRKLYYLHAGHLYAGHLYAGHESHDARSYYTRLGTRGAEPIPVGFVIVKQSWTAVPATPEDAQPTSPPGMELAQSTDPPAPITWVEHEGQRLRTGEQAELFVMAKLGAVDMPGTDAGWIYGTLTPDGKTVTSAGRVQRCMDCHEAATHERLFGLQATKAFATVKAGPAGDPALLPPGFEP